jgi:DNA-binding response OmpR family regulator
MKKILIIEDNDTLATLLSNQLTEQNIAVSIARDGNEGLKKILEEKPDLVILDIVLPKKDGIAILEELHKSDPEDKTVVIVLSNSKDIEHIAGAAKHNVAAYLVKSDQDLQGIVGMVKEKLGI